MQDKNTEHNNSFILTIISFIFFICVGIGIFAAFHTKNPLQKNLASFLNQAFSEKNSFKKIFLSAAITDFKYTLFVLLFAGSTHTSLFPAAFIGYRGFSAGFSVIVASRIVSVKSTAAVGIAVFLSCIFTVPVYALMFILCRKCSKKLNLQHFTIKDKIKEYAIFTLSVMILFSALCIGNCIQALLCPLFLRFAEV